MTNAISSYSSSPLVPEPGTQAATGAAAKPSSSANAAAATSSGEAVTISASAQATTQLLNAARDATGIDHTAVQQIRTALKNGTYNVAPEDLAHAIATVLKETK